MSVACYLFIEVKPSDELLASLSRNHRHSRRRALRRTDEDGVCSVLIGAEEVEQAARRLVALHRELRQGRRMARERLTPMFDTFVVGAARRMTDRGLGRIYELRRDGDYLLADTYLLISSTVFKLRNWAGTAERSASYKATASPPSEGMFLTNYALRPTPQLPEVAKRFAAY